MAFTTLRGRLWIVAASTVLWTACPRQVVRRPPSRVLSTAEAVIRHLEATAPVFSTLRLRYQAVYEGDNRQNFQLRVHVQGDSLLWASAGLMGFEGARLLVRKDSVFALNRLAREYYSGPLDSLRGLFPAGGLADLVALLTGSWPPGFSSFSWSWDAATHTLSTRSPYLLEAVVSSDAPLRLLRWRLSTAQGPLTLTYEWQPTGSSPCPSQLLLEWPEDRRLRLLVKEETFNPADLAFPFSMPEGYTHKPLSAFFR